MINEESYIEIIVSKHVRQDNNIPKDKLMNYTAAEFYMLSNRPMPLELYRKVEKKYLK